jgi:periplasmic copper chaperone A
MKIGPKLMSKCHTFLMVSILGILGLLFAGVLNAQAPDIIVRDAWARVPLPSKTETALYVVVENHSSQKRTIVSVSSDSGTAAEMHQMTMVKMSMVMTPISQVSIPARGKTSFNPNGMHIMVYGLKSRPAPGDTINATLKLDDGTTVPVVATVRK